MKIRFLPICASSALLLAGCVVEEAPMEGGSIAAVMEDIHTRTAVTDEGTFTWSAGDQVWLEITANPGYVTGTLSSGAGTGSANFSYGTYFGDMTGKAVYPFNSGHDVNGDELSVVLPASYDLGTNLSNTNAAMYGVETGGNIKFNHLAGVMRFKFRNAPAGTDRFILTLDKKINGTFTADLTEDHPVLRTESASSASEKSITLNFDPLTSAQDILLYVPLPLGTYTTLGLEVKAGSQSVWSYSNTVTNTINRKSLILMPTVTLAGSISGDIEGSDNTVNLSEQGTANSYIVSEAGLYKFSTVKGNSSESVGDVASAEVLWETFGTEETPSVGSLISNVRYKGGNIIFSTPESFREGNAVIAAKDANGTILWSWHIWLTDQPEEQVYYNNAGTMMDRNLGATSATPGDVGALGLLYQWGRKDPFLGSSSISSNVEAKSTITWPSAVSSNISNSTIDYATKYPTTFITGDSNNGDWHNTYAASIDNTRWTTSETSKSIYDPCPAGWRVPDGGDNGIWIKALGYSAGIDESLYNNTNEGMNFFGQLGDVSTIWYPASGCRSSPWGNLSNVGNAGLYWSVSSNNYSVYILDFDRNGFVAPLVSSDRADGLSVRCVKEYTSPSNPDPGPAPEAVNLSQSGTANSYIVSSAGSYKFSTVKGNRSESVGAVASAEVLWETFGTDVAPNVGDLVKNVSYNNGEIAFQTADTFKEGNAVIAAKDAAGTILWSWHIWLTDEPEEQVYYNNAGTVMDRNLGATSATPGDVGALGLLYQWGRKDPFLGSSSISSSIVAKSTITWPSDVSSNLSNGTIDYATEHPTTFIGTNTKNYDWYYTGTASTDNSRWTTSDTFKSLYDPCPAGWRVPNGGSNGIWSKSLGFSSSFTEVYDNTNEGINFFGKLGTASSIWYPASGSLNYFGGGLYDVGEEGNYWSASPYADSYNACILYFDAGNVNPSHKKMRALGKSVRCVRNPEQKPASEAVNLSQLGTANSYIVSSAGSYKFSTVKGNSSESVGEVASAKVLWETFGTNVAPDVGDLVKYISYNNGEIAFQTADTFKEGNAVIAAKDASGTILWSWHIWLTDQPQEQVYYNNAGTMMDRNLGATSATPGDVGALGLMYQWGRKDPFLGSSSISGSTIAKSTITWPSSVLSSSSNGTIAYATEHPTTFIKGDDNHYDWHYTGSSSTDDTRWQSEKTIYDPCPVGWRVPDGGEDGVWSTAKGSSSSYTRSYDNTNEGMNFSADFGNDSLIWYPASGYRTFDFGNFNNVGSGGYYWSCSTGSYDSGSYVYSLKLDYYGYVNPIDGNSARAYGRSVRCLQE